MRFGRLFRVLLVLGAVPAASEGEAMAGSAIEHECTGGVVVPRASTCRAVFDSPAYRTSPAATLSGCFLLADGRETLCERRRVLARLIDNRPAGSAVHRPDADLVRQKLLDISNFYEEVTYGKLILEFDVAGDLGATNTTHLLGPARNPLPAGYGWRVLGPTFVGPSNPLTLGEVSCDVDPNGYSLFLNVTPMNTDGTGQPGVTAPAGNVSYTDCAGIPRTLAGKRFSISRAWNNDVLEYAVDLSNHELGHGLGLDHALSESSITGEMRTYGDDSDTMGENKGHFRAKTKVDNGWLPARLVSVPAPVAATGVFDFKSYEVDALERNEDAGLAKALKIGLDVDKAEADNTAFMWIEARRSDPGYRWSVRGGYNLEDGVLVRLQRGVTFARDMTPETPDHGLTDGALMPGRTYSYVTVDDTVAPPVYDAVHVTVTSSTPGADGLATVDVYRAAGAALPANAAPTPTAGLAAATAVTCVPPACSATPHNADLGWPGPTVEFTANFTDPDGDALSYFWNFEVGTGDKYGPGDYASGQKVVHTFAAGTRRVWLTVSDRKGGIHTTYVDPPGYVDANAPVIQSVSAARQVGLTYAFAAWATDADGDLLSYDWTFHDGTTSSSPTPIQEYSAPGTHAVLVSVDDGSRAASTSYYVHVNRSWEHLTECAANPGIRASAAMAADPKNEMAVLFGGWDGTTAFDDTWVWKSGCWSRANIPAGLAPPTARFRHAMAFDQRSGTFLMFGGRSTAGTLPNETFTLSLAWNAVTSKWDAVWTKLSPAVSPPARVHHDMVQAGAAGKIVMFGGRNGAAFPDTWVWDGITWAQDTRPGPSKRSNHNMVWDEARKNVVMFGGGDTVVRNQTWTWTEANGWTQVFSTVVPPARKSAVMAYDAHVQRVTLFGGENDASTPFGDVWEWSGTNWMNMSPPPPVLDPTARRAAAATYLGGDTDRLLVYGGDDGAFVGGTYWLKP